MFKVAIKRFASSSVAGIAAAALFSSTAAWSQEAPAQQPKQMRVITDPAEIEAILAECGLSIKAPSKKSAAAPAAPAATADAGAKAGKAAPSKRRCRIGGPGDLPASLK
jgi:hypothetical protein